MDNSSRERAIEAFWLLNDFIGDLITGTRAFEYFDTAKFKAGATDQVLRSYNKMASSFIFLTLAKWIEFWLLATFGDAAFEYCFQIICLPGRWATMASPGVEKSHGHASNEISRDPLRLCFISH